MSHPKAPKCYWCGKREVRWDLYNEHGMAGQGSPWALFCSHCYRLQWPTKKHHSSLDLSRHQIFRARNFVKNDSPHAREGLCLCSRHCGQKKQRRPKKDLGSKYPDYYPLAKGHQLQPDA